MKGVPAARGLWMPAVLALALAWGCAERESATPVPGGDPALGADLLRGYTCGGCHVIPGVSAADGQVGPPLNDWASRSYIAGAVWNTPQNLMRFIMDPAAVEPGTSMPDLDVREDQARHMTAYLFTLGGEGSGGPPRLFPVEWLERLGHGGGGE